MWVHFTPVGPTFDSQNMSKYMKTDIQLEVIFKIKQLRQHDKISQAHLADILSLSSYGLIGSIESTKYPHKYTLAQLKILSDHFEFPFSNLFLTDEECALPKEKFVKVLINKIIEYGK